MNFLKRDNRYTIFFQSLVAIAMALFLSLPTSLSAQELNSTTESADSLIVHHLEKFGVKFSHDNSVTLLMNGQEKFDDMFKAIDQARSSIHMEYFNFRNDSINRVLISHLVPKVKEGVEVRLLFDGFGNVSNNQPMRKRDIDSIRARGIEIYEFNPVRFPWLDDIWSRDHRKIVVIDGKIAYTGGMNVADYYIKGTEQVGSWHDMHCRIQGKEVNTLQTIFLKMWNKVSGQNIHGAKYYRGLGLDGYFKGLKPDTCQSAGHKMVGIINREPHTSNEIIREFYTNAIRYAHDSIKIINPYFTLNHALKKALRDAAKRGVKVEIMLSVKSDIPLTPDCGFYNAHKLMEHGCNIYLYKPGFHHTKIIMVDGKFCTVGSANLNSRSLSWDYEANAVIIDPCTTRELNDLFDSEKKDSFILTEETWKKWRSKGDRFKGWFASIFLTPFL